MSTVELNLLSRWKVRRTEEERHWRGFFPIKSIDTELNTPRSKDQKQRTQKCWSLKEIYDNTENKVNSIQ